MPREIAESMSLRDLLSGGDRRSIGRADEVSALLSSNPSLIGEALQLMVDAEPVVRMRSADALEKASRADPTLLAPYKTELLTRIVAVEQEEVKWHVLQMLPRLELSAGERDLAIRIAEKAFTDGGSIVQAEALSALFALAQSDADLTRGARRRAELALTRGSPALRARARRLLREA